eukprot:Blabericola_migrator_1__21@NODE_1006_length_5721_cov_24_862575_g414_i2_p1_GENE_NODE_1006_length_5721_cov_24_862575_g414_i2NODE_1006_length_5721_cov_24_862575_g414_i2_p1_ORF_typecomplete_len882_score144_81zfC2HC5/PF06221_13/3_4e14ASCH/PF04266_14/1_3e12_NODE_1006_length_5721_cov_24_862575_g414_i29243569
MSFEDSLTEWALVELAALLRIPKAHLDASQADILASCSTPDELADYLSGFIESETAYTEARDFAVKYFVKRMETIGDPQDSRLGPRQLEAETQSNFSEADEVSTSSHDEAYMSAEEGTLGEMVSVQKPQTTLTHRRRLRAVKQRMECRCNGTDHPFAWNCIECGRIMCEAEKPGPCLFCGAAGRDDKRDRQRWRDYEQLDGYAAAKALVTRLVEYDRDAVKRTEIKDMETDFYAEKQNPWATEEEREWANIQDILARQPKQEGVVFDFVKGEIRETNVQAEFELEQEQYLRDFLVRQNDDRGTSQVAQNFPPRQDLPGNYVLMNDSLGEAQCDGRQQAPPTSAKWEKLELVDRDLQGPALETYKELDVIVKREAEVTRNLSRWHPQSRGNESSKFSRSDRRFERLDGDDKLDDDSVDGDILLTEEKTYDESASIDTGFCVPDFPDDTSDMGVCLSLHQPWASLLVYGFKRLEGRVWQTDYRGRLWIHAASTEPDHSVVQNMQTYYSKVYGKHPPFPATWPTSALLGCVDIIDCVPKLEVLERIESGKYNRDGRCIISRREDNDSPYLFVCKAPRPLVVPIQMSGNHKLWHLPRYRLPGFQKSLRPVPWGLLDQELEASKDVPQKQLIHKSVDHLDLDQYFSRALRGSLTTRPELTKSQVLSPMSGVLFLRDLLVIKKIEQLLLELRLSIETNELFLDETLGYHMTDFGCHYDTSHRDWYQVRHDQDESEVPDVPPKLTVLFEAILSELTAVQAITLSSVGGPHMPPLESAQVIFIDKTRLSNSFTNPVPGSGNPILLLVLSGKISFVLEHAASPKSVDRAPNKTMELIQRDNMATCDLKRGDCLHLTSKVSVTSFLRLKVEDVDPVRGILLLLLRGNLWNQ